MVERLGRGVLGEPEDVTAADAGETAGARVCGTLSKQARVWI